MTKQMTFRGILAVRADSDISSLIKQITAAQIENKAKIDGRLDELQSQLADVASKAAAHHLNGGGGEPVTGLRREVSAALRSLIRQGDEAPLAQILEANASMSVGVDPDGGYSVIPHFSSEMTRRVYELSPMRQISRVLAVSSGSFEEIVDKDEADATWVGETQSRPETTTPQIGKLSIPVQEIYAMPKVTQRLLDDSTIDIGAWLVEKCSLRFARKEGQAFVSGDGVGKPRGFLTYPTAVTADATRAWGTFQHVNTGASGAFAATGPADVLVDLVYALKAPYRANARWVMNRQSAGRIRKMKDADGRFLWTDGLAAGQPPLLLGFPVTLCEDMPDIGADTLSIAFGDFGAGYTIVDRFGLRLLRDPYSSKPNILFYAHKRVGGDVNNFEAIKMVRFGT